MTKVTKNVASKKTKKRPDKTIVLLVCIGVALVAVLISSVLTNKDITNSSKKSDASTSNSSKPHTPQDAVTSVNLLYTDYLPQKQQTVAAVGDNPNVEPAAVQVVRGNEVYFTPKFYKSVLTQYMDEFQSTGKVTQDAIACVNNTTNNFSAKLVGSKQTSATVNVSITLQDGSKKTIPVTVDLKTLKISWVSCSD